MNEKLNFHDLVGLLSEKEGITKKEAENFLREFFDLVTSAILTEKQVKIRNFGTIKSIEVSERESVDVNTGKRLIIPAHTKLSFHPDTHLGNMINEPFSMFEPVEIESDENQTAPDKPVQESIPDKIENTPVEEKFPTPLPVEDPIPNPDPAETVRPVEFKSAEYKKKKQKKWSTSTVLILLAVISCVAGLYFGLPYIYRFVEGDEPALLAKPSKTAKSLPEDNRSNSSPGTTVSSLPQDSVIINKISNDSVSINSGSEQNIPAPLEKTAEIKKRKVAAGERLTLIALEEYGEKAFWIYIYEENKKKIKNPGNVGIGLELIIPPADKYKIDKNDPESVAKAKKLERSIRSNRK